jgi:hypothetical protein
MTKFRSASASVAFAIAVVLAPPVFADDWTAVKLRGIVLGLYDGEWVKLQRGAVVPDETPIRTMRSGRVTFERDAESIDLGPDTLIQIFDRAGRTKHTTVKQHFGQVAVEAEVREVNHFSVRTPHLAAVVKGTRFVVTSGKAGAKVKVGRGAVAVSDSSNSSVTIVAGQEVTAKPNGLMTVAGRGKLPQVLDARGKPVKNKDSEDKGSKGSKDKGSTDSDSKDKGSTESGSKDKDSTDSDSKDKGSTESGSKDKGSTESDSKNKDKK